MPQPAGDRHHGLHGALRRAVHVQLAVLPVGHRGARLERLMAGVRRDEGFVEHERRVLEAGLEIAERPLVGRLAHRQLACVVVGEVRLGPFHVSDDLGRRRGCPCLGAAPDVAADARVGPAGPQAVQRIDDEGQRLELDLDFLDRLGRGELVDGGDGQDRLALVDRLVGERLLAFQVRLNRLAEVGDDVGGRGEFVGGEDRLSRQASRAPRSGRCASRARAASG